LQATEREVDSVTVMMQILSASHNHGDIIVEYGFPEEYKSLTSALQSIDIPLRPLGKFSANSRPKEPKRHIRAIEGRRKPFLLPVDQSALNKKIEALLRPDGWEAQPVAAGDFATGPSRLRLKGDFVRNGVFVEVEFGNIASMHRDFFKFQIANRAMPRSVAVLVVATEKLAKYFDSGVTTFEAAKRHIPYLVMGIQMPIWIVGIEPISFDDIGTRYGEMHTLCTNNGLDCHTFDETTSLATDIEETSDDDE
jgi:hypothetical protein